MVTAQVVDEGRRATIAWRSTHDLGATEPRDAERTIILSLDVLIDCYKDERWTRFIRLRLEALWAMRKTTGIMQAICNEILAVEPFGSMLRAQEDIKGPSKQLVLLREDLAKLIHGLAPNGSESFRRSVDQKALPELLRVLSMEVFAELLEYLRQLLPGARTHRPA